MAFGTNSYDPQMMTAYDFETLTPLAATALTAAKLNPADRVSKTPPRMIIITAVTAVCSFRIDGGVPTATVGILLATGDSYRLHGRQHLVNFQVIGAGTVNITYFR